MKSFAVGIWGAFWAVTWVAVAGSGAGSAVAAALATDEGPAVSYRVSFANAVHHEAEIEVTFRGVTADPLEVRMSRSSPGRYGLHEFARHVYDVRAVDGAGKELTIARPDPHQWNVGGHDGTVVVTYTLFGDLVSGTYTAIDATHAHLNAPATFLWARGMTERPVRVRAIGEWRRNWRRRTSRACSRRRTCST